MECAEVLWTKRAQHKTGGLSTQRAEIFGNPHIKSSRDLIRFSSREYSQFSENLVEIYHHLIKSSRDSHHHSILSYIEIIRIQSRRATCIQTSLYHHIHTYMLTPALDSCIMCVYTSRYIMHKRVYTVTLDIECWDDLKLDSIDWAKRVGLFPDEYIHSSVQELTSPRLVDRT